MDDPSDRPEKRSDEDLSRQSSHSEARRAPRVEIDGERSDSSEIEKKLFLSPAAICHGSQDASSDGAKSLTFLNNSG